FGPPALSAAPFGVFYAARDEATSIAEVKHHRTGFMRGINAPAQDLDFDFLNSEIKGSSFYDLRDKQDKFAEVYSPDDYSESQRLAIDLKERDADGIAYDSVRREGGECVAVFRPRCVVRCKPVKQVSLRWDGKSISAVLEAQKLE
ncbi:MAG TPA: RES family NAD+ phosphorylase, partial [Gemmatimonadaceae bacterium]|nr:RES family NAD+ phosphorylase [Gemmatimonadaceae bacterium]